MAFSNFAELIAQYNSSLPTLSNGQASPLQVDANGRLLVQADVTVVLSHTNDSVQIGDGTDLLAVNADGSINVTINNASIAVTATDLDIRDLDAAQDNVAISDGTDTLAVNADGSINVTVNNASISVTQGTSPWVVGDGGGSLTVDATDLDIRDIDAAQDNIAISDGTDTLAVNADGSINVTINNASVTVTATDLDIRDLDAAQDNVAISDGTDTLAVNTDGSINVVLAEEGAETDFASDPAGDGLVAITVGTAVLLAQQAVDAGEEYKIHAWSWASDIQGTFALEVRDNGVLVEIIRLALNAGSNPTGYMHFPRPIEIAGATDREVRVYFTRAENKNGNAHAGVNGELIV